MWPKYRIFKIRRQQLCWKSSSDVTGKVQVAQAVLIGPMNAIPNACSCTLQDIVEGDKAEERGQYAALSDTSDNLEKVCIVAFGLDAAA